MTISGIELATVVTALAHGWEPASKGVSPPQRLAMGPVQESHPTSVYRRDRKIFGRMISSILPVLTLLELASHGY